jgi:hypothetical protein
MTNLALSGFTIEYYDNNNAKTQVSNNITLSGV